MVGITQGSVGNSSQSAGGSTAIQASAAGSTGNNASNALQNRQQSRFNGNSQPMVNLIQQLISQLQKWAQSKQPQPKPLELTQQQDQALRNRFGVFGELNYQVLDNNRDGKLSAGDELVIAGGFTGGEISRQKLTQQDVDAINNSGQTAAQSQLDANRQKWESQPLADYSFTLQRSCFCRGDAIRPVNIEVADGKVASATFADTGEPLPEDLDYNKLTVNDLFDTIQQAITDGAARVDVSYDQQSGVPASIYIDRSEQIADEEVGFTISNFRAAAPAT
ncbi:DUF6174 domain-containing protein [Candidatus Thiothrix sp. Deng01]|uniref:DUF6174 domain-containing protein n=1 Tax=Candidatus Thiothrix phosphatis TaxID=3112415 RepID=A0ABU6CYR9_9GAMM|nr:DUF6174 domain-containing protein [Candidatus Thiothrix sp. Deng01]MEB4591692.1 DUF6174 domain-containing protein [Candidatus Thiothrix sp. Deng01]